MSYFGGGGSTPAIACFVMDTSDYFAATNVEDALSELYALFGTVTGGLDWQASVLDKDRTNPVGGETGGERYIVAAAGAGGLWTGKEAQLCEFDGNTSTWDFMVPDEGTACWVDDEDTTYVFTGIHGAGGSWVKLGTTIDHENLTNKIHDGDTLQLDGVNSDGGAFAFVTSGAVTFGQNVVIDTTATGQATYIANSQANADARFFFQENDGNKGYLQYDATNNRITLGNSSSGELFYLKDAGEAQITCDLTGVGLNLTSELDMTGAAAFIDLNPASTGSKNIIDITPSAGLNAGSDWYGIKMTLDALDPATGASSDIMGIRVDASDVTSVDNDATLYGYYYNASPTEGSYGFYHRLKEMTQNKNQRGFLCYANEVLSATASYFGFKVSWSGVTRDANAPVLKGLDIQLPADYTGFGTSYAGFFEGDGRSVLVCDTTYALDVSGAMRLDGAITGVNTIALDLGTSINEISIDDTLAGNSDDAVPTEQAVKAYVDGAVGVGGHFHDGDTLQHDGVNSDGGAFAFNTTGAVTFNQAIVITGTLTGVTDLTITGDFSGGSGEQDNVTAAGFVAQAAIAVTAYDADCIVFVEGVRQRVNSGPAAWDYDYYVSGAAEIKFSYAVPIGTTITMELA